MDSALAGVMTSRTADQGHGIPNRRLVKLEMSWKEPLMRAGDMVVGGKESARFGGISFLAVPCGLTGDAQRYESVQLALW